MTDARWSPLKTHDVNTTLCDVIIMSLGLINHNLGFLRSLNLEFVIVDKFNNETTI